MSRVTRIKFRGTATGYSQAAELLKHPGDAALDYRGVPRSIVMACPDGCGEILTINLDKRSGKAWRADFNGSKLSIYPSVWRDQGCKSHFIIWNSQILWCDWNDKPEWLDEDLIESVLKVLQGASSKPHHYETLADELGENPWEVLWACQTLVHRREASSINLAYFRAISRDRSSEGTQ